MKFPVAGQTVTKGYPGEMIKYTIDNSRSISSELSPTAKTAAGGANSGVNLCARLVLHIRLRETQNFTPK